jgi:PAS domain S-box-containing protein
MESDKKSEEGSRRPDLGPLSPRHADEATLARSERRLRLALDAGRFGTWDWELGDGAVHWSEELERMHGLPAGSFAGTFEAFQSHLHPDDRAHVLSTIRANVETASDHTLLYRIMRPDGAVRWLEAHGRFELDQAGVPRRLIGVCGDVTDRVLAEQARADLAVEQAARREAEQAAARTQQILAGIADAFVVCASDWRVVFANDAGARLFGWQPGQAPGAGFWELATGAIGAPMEEALRRVMSARVAATLEDRSQPRGEWRELRAFPLSEGGLAFYARDITARKQQEERSARMVSYAALRAEVGAAVASGRDIPAMLQGCCAAVVSHLPMAFARIWLLDPTRQWLELQASAGAYAHLAGAPSRVRVGAPPVGRVASEGKAQLSNALLDQAEADISDQAWARREGMVAFGGTPLMAGELLVGVLAAFATAPLPEDTVSALAGLSDVIAHGIERRRAELELDERARELARSNADLEQFAYVASHDLQEPLRIVASYNQLLARRYRGKLDQDADEFIAFSVNGVIRMQRLISDLLAYSRVGTRGREFGPVALDKALAAALENLAQAIADAQAEVTHDALPDIPGDQGQLTQLLQNLIGNAVKFHGPAAPRVHLGARQSGADWIFAVSDNGVGIEPQYFERIFVIFQRLHSIQKYPGTGIGLALCKKIVERHGGRIWVESALGQGTTFFFALPGQPSGPRPAPAPPPR